MAHEDGFLAGQILRAAQLDHVGFPDRALYERTSAQTIAHNTAVFIVWNATAMQQGFELNGANNGVIVPESGLYLVTTNVDWAANSTGIRVVRVQRGVITAGMSRQNAASSGFTGQSVSVIVDASKDDVFSVDVLQASGGNLDVVSFTRRPNLGLVRLA